jgi:transposase
LAVNAIGRRLRRLEDQVKPRVNERGDTLADVIRARRRRRLDFTRGHRYFTLVNDLDRSRVLYVAENRTESSLDGFWAGLTEAQVDAVEAVAMDMWDPYINSTLSHLPDAGRKIVFDKFHIAKHLSEAVGLVRRRENKQLRAAGDDRLTGTRYDWLRHPAKMEPRDRREFAALRVAL